MNAELEEVICGLHRRIALTTAGTPLQDDLIKAVGALRIAVSRIAELEADKKTLINVVKDKSDFHATKDAMKIAELEAHLPKEGAWIVTTEVSDDGADTSHINCSRCGFYWREPKHGKVFKRCPNCGSRMRTVTDCHTLEEGER